MRHDKGVGVRFIGAVFVLAFGPLLVISALGPWVAAADSVAVFRLPIVIGLAVGTALLGAGWLQGLSFAAVLLGALSIVWHFLPSASKGPVTVYRKNMYFANADVQVAARDILSSGAEVAFLQEVTSENAATLRASLSPAFPNWHWCPFNNVGGTAIASKWSLQAETLVCPKVRGLTTVQAQGPNGPIWLASLHLHWPWPYRQATQFEQVLAVLEGLEGPIVLAGDFNMVPWSSVLWRTARVTGSQRAGGVLPTLHKRRVPLPIDHVFAPGGGRIETRPRLESDHRGVIAYISLD